MNRKTFHLIGLLAPILFILTAILGGILRPGYSHSADTVSELFSPGSPNRIFLTGFYVLFSACLVIFGAGLRQFVYHTGKNIRVGGWGASLFILVGILNLLTGTIFPQDPWGTVPTFPGEMHKIVSAIITLVSFGYMVLFGLWFFLTGLKKSFWIYSLATIAAAIAAGVWFTTSVGTPQMGIAERVVILIGLQYTVALSILVIRVDSTAPYLPD